MGTRSNVPDRGPEGRARVDQVGAQPGAGLLAAARGRQSRGDRQSVRAKVGLNSFIISVKDGKPSMLVEYVSDFLFAVDLKGDGVKRTLCPRRRCGYPGRSARWAPPSPTSCARIPGLWLSSTSSTGCRSSTKARSCG